MPLWATLWVAAGLALAVLPQGNGLRRVLGGDLRVWAVLSFLAALVWSYFWLLGQLKARAKKRTVVSQPTQKSGKFSIDELDRYARHIMLREIGGPGQKALKAAKVLVIGAGRAGSPALLYLAAAGVGCHWHHR